MMNPIRLLAVMVAVIVVVPSAGATEKIETYVHADCPVAVVAHPPEEGYGKTLSGLNYAITVTNESKETYQFIELVAYVFTSDGRLRGYHGMFEEIGLTPGNSVELRRNRKHVAVDPTDRVILAVFSLRGSSILSAKWVLPV